MSTSERPNFPPGTRVRVTLPNLLGAPSVWTGVIEQQEGGFAIVRDDRDGTTDSVHVRFLQAVESPLSNESGGQPSIG